MVILGKTNMDEFAMGSTTETSCVRGDQKSQEYGSMFRAAPPAAPARQWRQGSALRPWALIPADLSASPAAFCGVTGIEAHLRNGFPVGTGGLRLFPGPDWPIGKDAADCAALLEVIAGHDEKDSTSL